MYEDIKANLDEVFNQIKGTKTRLLAVTKYVSVDKINFAIDNGVDLIGENKVQELLSKYDQLKKDNLEIHLIGNLQTNKVKYIIDKVDLIHSVDRLSLAKEIDKQAKKINKIQKVLIEINVGNEVSKGGVLPNDVFDLIDNIKNFENIKVVGLMCIPPFTQDSENSRKYFKLMKKMQVDINAKKLDNINVNILSMGMSGDYLVAIDEGSDIIRLGTKIFGKRNY